MLARPHVGGGAGRERKGARARSGRGSTLTSHSAVGRPPRRTTTRPHSRRSDGVLSDQHAAQRGDAARQDAVGVCARH